MTAKYIIRLDDASEFMNYEKWDVFFDLFDKYGIKPIIAVIPNNNDPKLLNNNPDSRFWETVRRWESKEYCIALHGYSHVYTTLNSGLLGINKYSEFAGVELATQKKYITLGIKKFEEERIFPKIFVAPAHSFDNNTITALIETSNIRIISDGFFCNPIIYKGIKWLPQQLSRPKERKKGTWTICYHPETSSENTIIELEVFLKRNFKKFVNPQHIVYKNGISLDDIIHVKFSNLKLKILHLIKFLHH